MNYIQHFNPYHDPKSGQFTSLSGGRVITSKDEKKEKKLSKKWDYIEPGNKKEAHKHVAKKAVGSAVLIGAGTIATQAYINKKILNKPIKTAFNKKNANRAIIYGLITGVSNAAYDEILYARKGVIRK